MRYSHIDGGVTAPKAAEELVYSSRDGKVDNKGSVRLFRFRVLLCCCFCNSGGGGSSSSSGGKINISTSSSTRGSSIRGEMRRRGCGCYSRRWTSLCTRKSTRQSGAIVLLFLAAAFSLRGWRAAMMINSGPFGVGRWSSSSAGEFDQQQQLWRKDEERSSSCEWKSTGSLLFNLQHSKLHAEADASRWDHIADCFLGRRSEFKEYISVMRGTDVYIKDSDATWSSRLTPMTRLLLIAGLTSVGARAVHFVDDNHASFSFPSSSSDDGGAHEVAGGALRGGDVRETVQPEPGQVGVLRLDDVGHKSQFVVSTEQPLPYRLEVSAPVPPARSWDGRAGVRSGSGGVGGARPGGGGGTQECVKFARSIGSWEQGRPEWFVEEEDARDLLRAVDNFCPIPWLRKQQQQQQEEGGDGGAFAIDDGDEDLGASISPLPNSNGAGDGRGGGRFSRGLFATMVGGPGRGHGAGAGGLGLPAGANNGAAVPKKLIIYQRDRNRKVLKADELADELWIRLGHIGWSVTEVFHDDQRHPCDLIAQVADADVLLTAHGFQSMLSFFMAPGSVLFEVYPHKYFQEGYGSIAKSLGLRYGFSTSPPVLPLTSFSRPSLETCMKWRICRSYVRRSDVVVDEDSFELLISLMLRNSRVR